MAIPSRGVGWNYRGAVAVARGVDVDALSHWIDLIVAAVGSFIAAIMGVAMRHAHKVQRGEPLVWSRVWLDAPTVFVMGIAGAGVGQYLHTHYAMPDLFGGIVSASLGYLGPSVIDRLLDWLDRQTPKKPPSA